ncbi:hypothetical protein ONA00_06730 [Mycoplasmopsis cynos]|uniref:hypothetical protein n=1 Tax=Mycoplasmopsis cynos TaxID=171284 RepID=UPI0024C7DECF|nr:hypothetical protein [Mycoplasmopsis cynos]WAM10938.1 hypothetical protein ONA00_06730 [Mycoplasmopsis cynos]
MLTSFSNVFSAGAVSFGYPIAFFLISAIKAVAFCSTVISVGVCGVPRAGFSLSFSLPFSGSVFPLLSLPVGSSFFPWFELSVSPSFLSGLSLPSFSGLSSGDDFGQFYLL